MPDETLVCVLQLDSEEGVRRDSRLRPPSGFYFHPQRRESRALMARDRYVILVIRHGHADETRARLRVILFRCESGRGG